MATKNKLKIKIPKIRLKNPKSLLVQGPLIIILNLAEIFGLLYLPYTTLTAFSNEDLIINWLAAIVFLFVIRICKILFIGGKAFPQVKFDLTILTTLTILLIATILQGDSNYYSNLGGGTAWGAGTLMLAGLSMYLLATMLTRYVRASMLFRGFMALFNFSLSVYLLTILLDGQFAGSSTAILPLGILGVGLLTISLFSLIYYKSIIWKLVYFFGLAVSIYFVILSFRSALMGLIFALTTLVMSLFLLFTQRGFIRNLAKDFTSLRNGKLKFKKFATDHSYLFSLILFVVTAVIFSLTSLRNSEFVESMSSILNAYGRSTAGLTTQTALIGKGLSAANPSSLALFNSYGLIGVLAVLLFVGQIYRNTTKTLAADLKNGRRRNYIYSLALFAVFILLNIKILFSQISITETLILTIITTALFTLNYYSTEVRNYAYEVYNYRKITQKSFFKKTLGSAVWRFILGFIRLVVVVVLISQVPVLISLILGIF